MFLIAYCHSRARTRPLLLIFCVYHYYFLGFFTHTHLNREKCINMKMKLMINEFICQNTCLFVFLQYAGGEKNNNNFFLSSLEMKKKL